MSPVLNLRGARESVGPSSVVTRVVERTYTKVALPFYCLTFGSHQFVFFTSERETIEGGPVASVRTLGGLVYQVQRGRWLLFLMGSLE